MISSVTYERSTWAAGAAQVRGGNAGDPGRHRPWRRDPIRRRRSATTRCRARGEPDRPCAGTAGGIEGVTVIGRAQDRGGVVSFTLDGAHAHDVATLLDRQGIAVRAGHHCAEPLMRRLGLDSTARASFGVYTTHEEIDALADALVRVREFFGRDVRRSARPVPGGHPGPRPPAAARHSGWRRSTRPPRATTRCAAIACRCGCGTATRPGARSGSRRAAARSASRRPT